MEERNSELKVKRMAALKTVVVALLVLGAAELGLDLTPEKVIVIVGALFAMVWGDNSYIKSRPGKTAAMAAMEHARLSALTTEGPPADPT